MLALPKIVIVTPSFNQGQYLEQTIKSVLDQKYSNLSYFIIDGQSKDNSINIIRKYEDQLSGWVSEPDSGQTSAINKGWLMDKEADLYAWINSDDYLLPGCLEAIAEVHQDSKSNIIDIGVIAGSGLKVDLHGNPIVKVDVNKITKHCPRTAFQFLQSSMFITKAAINEFGMLNESLVYTMDWEFVLRISKKYRIKYIDALLSAQRQYNDTKTRTGGWERLEEIAMVGRMHNGITDRNYLLYQLYSWVIFNSKLLKKVPQISRERYAGYISALLAKATKPRSHMISW